MSIAYSSKYSYTESPAGTSHTESHTVGGSDDLLVIVVESTVNPGDAISGITYNGVSMTRAEAGSIILANNRWTYIYYLASPATGANNIVISCSLSTALLVTAINLTGADTSSPLDTATYGVRASAQTALTFTLTIGADDCMMIAGCGENDQTSMLTNTTLIDDYGTALVSGRSTANVNTGSNSIGWNVGYSTTRYAPVASFKSGGGGGGGSFKPIVASFM